jgi:hypothetical protein
MKRLLLVVLIKTFGLYSTEVLAQAPTNTNWHLEKQANGITVYTANVAHSDRKYIKVTAELEGTLNDVMAVFQNIAQQKDWVYSTKQAYLIQQSNGHSLLYYNETSLPWPASNRDIAISMKLTEDSIQHKLIVTQEGKPNAIPPNKGIVRIPHLSANWQFRKVAAKQLSVDYFMDIDPGGSLPAWVINLFIAKGPYETFSKLRELLKTQ